MWLRKALKIVCHIYFNVLLNITYLLRVRFYFINDTVKNKLKPTTFGSLLDMSNIH